MKLSSLQVLFCIFVTLAVRAPAADYFWRFGNSSVAPQTNRDFYLYPGYIDATNGGFIVTGDRQRAKTDASGMLIMSNLVPGFYRSEFQGTYNVTTNFYNFPDTNGYLPALDYLATPTNAVIPAGIAVYSQAQSDARYFALANAGTAAYSNSTAFVASTNGVLYSSDENPRTVISTSDGAVGIRINDGTVPGIDFFGGEQVRADGQFVGDGGGLTFLNASQLSFGTVPDARLSSNVPLKTEMTNVIFSVVTKADTVYNVKNYGALGDGSHDDTAAIQLCSDMAGTNGGGVVYFPSGNYKISAPPALTNNDYFESSNACVWVLGTNITFRGDGPGVSRIFMTNLPVRVPAMFWCGSWGHLGTGTGIHVPVVNLEFNGLSLDGGWDGTFSYVNAGATAIDVPWGTNIVIQNCNFYRMAEHGFDAESGSTLTSNIRIENCGFYSGWEQAVHGNGLGTAPYIISGCYFVSNLVAGVDALTGFLNVSGCTFIQNGIDFKAYSPSLVSGCLFRSYDAGHTNILLLGNGAAASIVNCQVLNNSSANTVIALWNPDTLLGSDDAQGSGPVKRALIAGCYVQGVIMIQSADGCKISDNILNGEDSINFISGGGATNMDISDNLFMNTATASMRLVNCYWYSNTVSGNRFRGTGAQGINIFLLGGGYNVYQGNSFYGPTNVASFAMQSGALDNYSTIMGNYFEGYLQVYSSTSLRIENNVGAYIDLEGGGGSGNVLRNNDFKYGFFNLGSALGEYAASSGTAWTSYGNASPLDQFDTPVGPGLVYKGADYTLTANESSVIITASGVTITLPTAVGITGKVYNVTLAATGSATVATTSSQTIGGSTTYSLASVRKGVTVKSDGANWTIVASN